VPLEKSMQGKCVANVCSVVNDPAALRPSTSRRLIDDAGSFAFARSMNGDVMYSSDSGVSYRPTNAISCSEPNVSQEVFDLCRSSSVPVLDSRNMRIDARPNARAKEAYRIEFPTNVVGPNGAHVVDKFVWFNTPTTRKNDDAGKLEVATQLCAINASACPATYCGKTSAGCVPNGARVPEIILTPLGGR